MIPGRRPLSPTPSEGQIGGEYHLCRKTMAKTKIRVSTRGRITIPKPFRDELGIEPGDDVHVWLDEGGAIWVSPIEPG